ncbi:hypothetical protein [Novosphingobium sp.]|uniref:hypothetical protein n=1 Tax=Novosphingobium sp. TaxID=1874826 RepID=UPI00286DBF46|nr:hypothetical protein [Novosphingobium sp.]
MTKYSPFITAKMAVAAAMCRLPGLQMFIRTMCIAKLTAACQNWHLSSGSHPAIYHPAPYGHEMRILLV